MESQNDTFFLHPDIDLEKLNDLEKKNFLFSGPFDIHRFRDSLRYLIKKDRSLLQHQIDVVFRDISDLEREQQDSFLTKYETFNHVDIVDQKWWMQFAFFQLSEQSCRLVWTVNHAQSLRWKAYLFLEMVFDVYRQDHEFAIINHSLDLIDKLEIQNYWHDQLINIDTPTELAKLLINVDGETRQIKHHKRYVYEKQPFNQWLNEENISPQALYQAAWAILLWRYHDQDLLSFATTKKSGLMFPLRLQINAELTCFNLMHQVQDTMDQCKLFPFIDQTYPFDHLFQVSDPFEPAQGGYGTSLDDIERYPLYIHVNGNKIDVVYDEQYFLSRQIDRMIGHLQNILQQIYQNPHMLLQDIEILSADEKNQLLYTFNETKHPLPSQTVDQLIEQKASEQPNSLAVVSDQHTLTYQELTEQADRLATILQNKGIRKGEIVGLMTKNSAWMFVGILGIMKAGAVYLPIDRNYPQNRIHYLLADSLAQYLLIESGVEVPPDYDGEVFMLDESYDQANLAPLQHVHQKNDPAYMIYTSGSTGKPKGVLVPHSALLNLVTWHNAYYQVTNQDRSTKYAGFGFDASVWEIFPYLVAGATIYIVPDQMRYDLDDLHQYYEQNQITCSFLPTQIAEQFSKKDHQSLRVLLTGGDRLRRVTGQSYQIVNNYGPTENAVVTTSGFVDPSKKVISIGKPIFNNQVYILSRYNQLQPIGVPGELCISGDSLAIGYFRRSQLTNERFVNHPFISGKKMYRTGDLARWLPDGSIEYLGRIDNQVKIRGYRIELGEIESQLLKCNGVESAVVITQPNAQRDFSLCAYLVVENAERIASLRTELARELPEYMIPDHWIQIDQIPLTLNGKVDVAALPKPQRLDRYKENGCTPISETERKLIQLWTKVLDINAINRKDHFFQLGGHSLKATMLISRIRQQWGVKLTLADFFEFPTISEMARLIDQSEPIEKIDKLAIVSTDKVEKQAYYPVSSVQKRLYALQQNKETGTAYHTPIVWEIKGKLDVRKLKSTIQTLVDRHEIFRTSLCFHQGELMQQIHTAIEWEIEHLPARDVLEAKKQVASFICPFQLEQAPLFRVGLVRVASDHHVLIWDMHHMLCDGITTGILHREFMQVYQGEDLPSLSLQYKDFAIWQHKQIITGQMEADQLYWRSQFSNRVPVASLPTDFPRPIRQQFRGEKISFSFDKTLTQACKQFSIKHDTTLYMLLFAVYSLLLAKYSHQDAVVVGSVVAGRSKQEWESICGMFVNTLPIKVMLPKDASYQHYLQEVKKQILQAQEHGDYPFAELIADLDIEWEAGRNPLFDTVFIAQNMDIPAIRIPNISINDFCYKEQHALFDMTWELIEQETLQLRIEYNTSLYQRETIRRMIDHFVHLLNQVLAKPEQRLSAFTLMTPAERKQVLHEFNHTQCPLPLNQTVLDLFANQIKTTPNQLAVVVGEQYLTYQQLHEQSNQLARLLLKKGVKSGQIVSILAEPSLDLFISILAVLKVGAAYLPIDPAYPQERIRYMLQDSRSSILLAPSDLWTESLASDWIDLTEKAWLAESTQDVLWVQTSNDLAYVIYTSGSTGKPKGVMVSHRALLNLVTWHNQYYQVTNQDRCTKYAGVGFDASVWEIFPYLSVGATIYVVDATIRHDVHALNQFFEENLITISFLPTAMAEAFIKLENRSLRALLVGGDRLRQIQPQTYDIFNNYGPTENAVVTTSYKIQDRADQKIPIGRPIFNNQVYIVDQALQLQPIGIPGELCIAGDSLASGYLHRAQLTAEKFVPDPFVTGQKMYRTGDLARWLPDGNLEYLGRMDQQVQIRGFRVEIGEIETHLLAHQAVKEVVVSIHQDENGQNMLCAYLVMYVSEQIKELRSYLAELLPEYMIPTYFMELESLPLTANGKVDREALPKPAGKPETKTTYVAPTNALQKRLVEIWEEVLQVPKIGIDDHFFSLGGDSIKAIQIAAQLQQSGQKIAVNDLIEHPTIRELTPYVKPVEENVEPEEIAGVVPLTPIQQWFFDQKFSAKHHWNQAVMIPSDNHWDIAAIERVFQRLIKRHDALRMRYVDNAGKIQQVNQGFIGQHFSVEVISCIHETNPQEKMEREANRLHRSLNLKKGPLVRVAVFQTKEKDYLFIIIHHLVVDGISWRILLDDFSQAYHAALQATEITFPAKSNSFQLWSRKLQAYANSEELLSELTYWQAIDMQKIPSICQGHRPGHGLYKDCTAIEFALSKSQTTHLLHDVHHAYRTEINDVLLAALGYAISEWAQVVKIAIQLEGHGREAIFEDVDITQTVGWFTSIYPVVLDIQTADLASVIKSVKETLHQVPNKGIGYGILRYLTNPDNKKEIEWRLKPEISFNYLGQFNQQVLFAGMGTTTKHLGDCFSSKAFMCPIEIYGMIVDDQLQFRFLFNQLLFKQESMQRLVDLYQHFLLKMIDHCMAQTEPTWTPSDFSAEDVSIEELDDFLESLD